jgi:hypothetical protein
MRRQLMGALTLAAILVTAAAARGAPPSGEKVDPTTEYTHDAITVATPGRHTSIPTATCLVWANAEGLGMGPAELDGMHGVSMLINPHPMAGDTGVPTPFAAGLAEMKSRFPKAPAWIWTTIEKNRDAIEVACGQDHEAPVKVHAITAQDRRG